MRKYDRFMVTKDIDFGKEIIKTGSLGQEIKIRATNAAKFTICGKLGKFTMERPEFLRKTKVANL